MGTAVITVVRSRGRRAMVVIALVACVALLMSPASATFTSIAPVAASFTASTAFTYPGGVTYDYADPYLRLADAAGATTLADASGSGATGVNPVPDTGIVGSRYQVAGAPIGDSDKAARFDGSGSYVVADTQDPSPTADYTYEIWFRTTSTSGGLLISSQYPTPNATTWSRMMYVDSGQRLTYGDWTSSDSQVHSVRSASTVTDGVWHHAVGTHIGNSVTLWLDGVSQGSVYATPQLFNWHWTLGGANVGWGGWWDVPPSNFFNGDLDEFAYYRYGLSSSQVAAHRTAATGTSYRPAVLADSPALYWRLNEPSMTVTAADQTANDYTGTFYLTNQIIGGRPGAMTTTPDNSTWFSGRQTNAYVNRVYSGSNNFTAYIWFRTTARRGGILFGFSVTSTGSSSGYDRHLWMLNGGRLAWGVYPGYTAVIRSTATYNDNVWHMAATSIGPAGIKLYVDGNLVAQDTAVTSAQSYSGYWRLGGGTLGGWPDVPWSEFFTGQLDEFSVAPTQLPDSRIAQMYAAR